VITSGVVFDTIEDAPTKGEDQGGLWVAQATAWVKLKEGEGLQ